MFVSRFHPQTTLKYIIDTLREHTGITMNVEKLQFKYDTYSSFCIRCSHRLRKIVLDPFLLGRGTVVKEYTERI